MLYTWIRSLFKRKDSEVISTPVTVFVLKEPQKEGEAFWNEYCEENPSSLECKVFDL